ncbi:MAG: CPBP family intramembrane metalloprotease [Chloroflexi bacterium]|jgi:membrane protease YdiL (CAAX protease family)|nr:CPBP family intramembrane metalloprotease [Chloroflexota bacterium]
MSGLGDLVWNREQRRLRMVWRLLATTLLGLGAVLVFSTLAGVALGLLIALLGEDSASVLRALGLADMNALVASPALLLVQAVLMTGITLGVLWLAARFVDRRPFADYGLHLNRGWWLDLAFGLGLGALLMTLIFLTLWAMGWVEVVGFAHSNLPGVSWVAGLLASLVGFIGVGIYEELISRGYLLENLAEGLRFPPLSSKVAVVLAWGISSALFGVAHATNPNATVISSFNLMVAGLLLGLGYVLTGELALPIGLHITWNFVQGPVFGFPVSGLPPAAALVQTVATGPEVWTGGAFGPEAGLLDLLSSLLGGLLIVLWVRRRRGVARLQEELAEPPAPRGGEVYAAIGEETPEHTGKTE